MDTACDKLRLSMPTDATAPLREPVGDAPDEIRALFTNCVRRQRVATPAKFEAVRVRAIQDLTFFPPSSPKFDSLDEVLIWRGLLYGKLLSSLRSAQNDEFWYRLALWIKSEGIREPEQFLPRDVYKRLTKEAEQQVKDSGLFGTGDFNAYLVRIWLRYTEPLLRKAKWLRQRKPPCDVKRELERNGFDPKILAVLEGKTKKQNWTSAVEFTCAWVAERGGAADAETLRNAYSRAYGQRMLSRISCSFCEKPAVNEFWVRGDPILHCREHRADGLPATENSARTDRFGRRWWREDLEIRCATAAA
jgi:hypothetical protein